MTTGIPRLSSLGIALSLLALATSANGAQDADLPEERLVREGDTVALLARYAEDRRALSRFWSIEVSPARLERLEHFDARWLELLEALDYEGLGVGGRVDWHLLRTSIESERHERSAAAARLAEIAELVPFLEDVVSLEEARWRLEEPPAEEVAERLARIAETVSDLEKRLEKEPEAAAAADEPKADAAEDTAPDAPELPPLTPSPVLAHRAAEVVRELQRLLGQAHRHRDEYEPGYAWWTASPYEAADEALTAYAKKLDETIAGLAGEPDDPLVGDPVGREALLGALAAECIAYSPEELIAIGEREFAWCEERAASAAGELGAESWDAALEDVKSRHVPPGEQDQLVARFASESLAFLDQRRLVTVEPLCRETWRIEMISEEGQRTLPFAAYNPQRVVVAYPTSGMDHERKLMSLRGNNEAFTRIVTPHELIPGHHLQSYMTERYSTHRRAFRTPFYVEGWALYWEMRYWDEGWARDAADQVGMLFWRMHRAARILVSLRFHLGEMTPEEMIDFLVERVGMERDGATAEVRRYVGPHYGPLYQCAYMIGGLQLRALHAERAAEGPLDPRVFHDAVLREGPIPIELLRAAVSETELPRDWRPSWRFAAE